MTKGVAAFWTGLFLAASCWADGGGIDQARPTLLIPSGLVLLYSGAGPMSYEMLTPGDIPKEAHLLGEVRGVGCQHGLSIPIQPSPNGESISGVIGNAGFYKAMRQIRQDHPALSGIFDVKVDRHTLSILGVYTRDCTEITALGFAYSSKS